MENDVRNILLGVKPPRPGQETQANKEALLEISTKVPLLKQIIGVSKGESDNEYVKGLVETFYRIYRALKENSSETILYGLSMKELKVVDSALAKSTTAIEGEYPQLVASDTESAGAFGAGVYAAFGLVEHILSLDPPPIQPEEEPEPTEEPEPKERSRTVVSELQEALTDVPAEEEPEPERPKPAKHSENCHDEIVIRVKPEEDEWKISVTAPANFASIANMAKIVERLFGKRAVAKAQMQTLRGQLAALFTMEDRRE